jgi:putative membrane protein
MDPLLKAILLSWNARPDAIAVLALLSTSYVVGWRRLRRCNSRSVKKINLAFYLISQAAVSLALLSPIDSLGAFLFTAHMIQHEFLMMVAAPLLLLSNPLPSFLWSLPRGLRLTLGGLLTKGGALRRGLRNMTRMVIALPVYLVTLWTWHYPPAFEAALRNDGIHDLQHVSFFIVGLLFWWPIINPAPKVHGHIPYGLRTFYVLAAALPTMLPVMALVLTERILYPYYTAAPRLWGTTVLGDQSNGWSAMALIEGATYLTAILLLLAKMAEHEERVERLKERAPMRSRASFKGAVILVLTSHALLIGQPAAWPNGGTPRLTRATAGPYLVSVWTKPEPPRVGRLHLSVAVMSPQDVVPMVMDARVRVAASPIHGQENLISANVSRTWGLLYDADLERPTEGPWRINLQVEGKTGNGSTGFELDVKPPLKVDWPVVGAILVLAILTAWWVIRGGRSHASQIKEKEEEK